MDCAQSKDLEVGLASRPVSPESNVISVLGSVLFCQLGAAGNFITAQWQKILKLPPHNKLPMFLTFVKFYEKIVKMNYCSLDEGHERRSIYVMNSVVLRGTPLHGQL